MKNIDKALLIKELKELSQSLEHQTLSMFETARAKSRILEIISLFNEPIFQKYLPQNLENAEAKAINANVLHRGLKSEALEDIPNTPIQVPSVESSIATLHVNDNVEISPISTESVTIKSDDQTLEPNSHQTIDLEESSSFEPTQNETEQDNNPPITENLITSINVVLGEKEFVASPVPLNSSKEIFNLPTVDTSSSIILVHGSSLDRLISLPIFMAEEVTPQGEFTQYVIYFGEENPIHATKLLEEYSSLSRRKIASIRELSWQDLNDCLFNDEALYTSFVASKNMIWEKPNYFPFIPQHLVKNQKFILFDEAEAEFSTPVLLLQERQRVRLICGKNRIALSKTDKAFPFVLFERQQGLSWQLIQEIISKLPQPIVTLDLLKELNKASKNNA
jgi:hypothetical protein